MLSTFYVLVDHLHVFFRKKIYIYSSLLPIFSWITWYFFLSFLFFFFCSWVSCMSPSFILEIYPLSNIWFKNTFSLFFSLSRIISLIVSSLYWWFPLLCRAFLVWHSPTCWFLLLLPILLLSYPKKYHVKVYLFTDDMKFKKLF